MGTLLGKSSTPVRKEREDRGSTASTRRSSQPRRSLLKILQRKSKETAYSEDLLTDEEEDGYGWFPASRVFPDDPEFSQQALKVLRAWHKDNAAKNYLPPLKDLQLLTFAHACLKDLEEAKLSITKYYTSMVDLPFLFSEWDLQCEAMQQCLNTIILAVMPVERPDGYRVMILRFRNTEPDVYHFKDAAKVVLMSIEALELVEGPPKGLSVVLDVTGMRFGHITRFHLPEVKQFLNLTQDVLPIIMHDFDVINCNYLVPMIMTAVKPFLSAKIIDMVAVHTSHDMSTFISKYTTSCLPSDYNGELDNLETYHNENIDRINRIVPYWQERQLWIDSRRLSHRKSSHRLHTASHATSSSTPTTKPSRATTPS